MILVIVVISYLNQLRLFTKFKEPHISKSCIYMVCNISPCSRKFTLVARKDLPARGMLYGTSRVERACGEEEENAIESEGKEEPMKK